MKITHTILDLFVRRKTTSKSMPTVYGPEWTMSCQTTPLWECIISAIARLILAIGLVIAGCKLSASMRATSLMKLGEDSQKAQECFAKVVASIEKVETLLKEYARSVQEMAKPMGDLRQEVGVLQNRMKELEKCIEAAEKRVQELSVGKKK